MCCGGSIVGIVGRVAHQACYPRYNNWGSIFFNKRNIIEYLKQNPAAPQRTIPVGVVDKGYNHVFYTDVDGDINHMYVAKVVVVVGGSSAIYHLRAH